MKFFALVIKCESLNASWSAQSTKTEQKWKSKIVAFYCFARYYIRSAKTIKSFKAFGNKIGRNAFGYQWSFKSPNLATHKTSILKSN